MLLGPEAPVPVVTAETATETTTTAAAPFAASGEYSGETFEDPADPIGNDGRL
jgi:hypothetical protein